MLGVQRGSNGIAHCRTQERLSADLHESGRKGIAGQLRRYFEPGQDRLSARPTIDDFDHLVGKVGLKVEKFIDLGGGCFSWGGWPERIGCFEEPGVSCGQRSNRLLLRGACLHHARAGSSAKSCCPQTC